jgi:hypothetical protein
MFTSACFKRPVLLLSSLLTMCMALSAHAAMDPRFELDPQSLGVPAATTGKRPHNDRRSGSSRDQKSIPASTTGASIYIIKPGDNLFKILMRDYGLKNDEAEAFIEDVCRENNITDIRQLKAGQKIVIPPLRRRLGVAGNNVPQKRRSSAKTGVSGKTFRLESPDTALTELETSLQVRQTWDRMLPPPTGGHKPVTIQSPTFSLNLDPHRYPVYSAMDNGRILVDRDDSIPPLVKELISEKDPSLRIVSESPRNGKRFLSAMLESAGFYSVEENFSMAFGSDPQLTVRSDFKIEKTPESIIKQDLILMNSGRTPYPNVIREFLKKEGLTVYEPFASLKSAPLVGSGQLLQIISRKQPDIIDSLLASLSITPEKDKHVDVFANDNNGISLSIKAGRYFEKGGQRHVVTRFDGDPVTYTLYRLLETKGYKVVMLEAQDDFRKITEKLLSGTGIQGTYARYQLGTDTAANYSLHMSGFRLTASDLPATGIFITSLEINPVIRDILIGNGYSITVR